MHIATWKITAGDDTAEISSYGGVLLSWQVEGVFPDPLWANAAYEGKIWPNMEKEIPNLRQIRQVVDGYQNIEELKSLDGFRSALLAPWPNRINGAKYIFQGKTYDLADAPVGGPEALHGLAHSLKFSLVEKDEDRLLIRAIIPSCEGYPFQVELLVEYAICSNPHRLSLVLKARNIGETDAPISLGWHPYFRAQTGAVDSLMITLPAEVGVAYNESMIPISGIKGFQQLANPVSFAHREDLDYGVTKLVTDENNTAVAEVHHADGCYTKVFMHNADTALGHGSFQVYSGQDLEHRHCTSVAVEPLLNMTDAFNRQECATDITVKPGGERVLSASVEFGYRG